MPTAKIDSLDHEGRGATRVEGGGIVEGACRASASNTSCGVPNRVTRQAEVVRLRPERVKRVAPRCPHYGVWWWLLHATFDAGCAGCGEAAPPSRTRCAIGKLYADRILLAIHGPGPGLTAYRARLGVRLVPSRGGLRVGFHERRSSYIVVTRTCPVLPPAISALLPRLRTMPAGPSIADRLPQVEIAVGETAPCSCFATCCRSPRRTRSSSPPSPMPRASRPGSNPAGPDLGAASAPGERAATVLHLA